MHTVTVHKYQKCNADCDNDAERLNILRVLQEFKVVRMPLFLFNKHFSTYQLIKMVRHWNFKTSVMFL